MFTLIIISLIVAVLGVSPLFFYQETRKISRFVSLLYVVSSISILYIGMPSMAYPLFGWISALLLVYLIVSSAIITSLTETPSHWLIPSGFILFLMLFGIGGCEMIRTSEYKSLIGDLENKNKVHWSQDIQPLNPNHIRLVPRELAITIAKTAMSEDGETYGSQYPLSESHATLQKIKGDYFYLIPMDFVGYKVWTNSDGVPGYIKVNATDPYAKPELIKGKKFKYTPNAYFYDNIERRLYSKYKFKVLMDYSFEEDDNGNAYWVISVCEPTISYWGLKTEGVIIYDAQTDNEKYVSLEQLEKDSTYKWVDRAIPSEIIEDNLKYWGNLKNGWWNSFWNKVNLLEPETPTINYSVDGKCVFVSPMTSTSLKDQTMTGLIYTDTRTGKSTYYTTTGGATEEAIVEIVNNAVAFKKWHASEQIVYENIYGELSAIVPVLSENGKNYMGLAIVETNNKRVALGTTPVEALMEYRKILSSNGQITTTTTKDVIELKAKVKRIGWDMSGTGKQYFLMVDKYPNYSFIISSQLQSEIALTEKDDSIKLKYIKEIENPINAIYFENITLNLQKSKNQIIVDSVAKNRNDEYKLNKEAKDFKDKVNKMSEQELKNLIKK